MFNSKLTAFIFILANIVAICAITIGVYSYIEYGDSKELKEEIVGLRNREEDISLKLEILESQDKKSQTVINKLKEDIKSIKAEIKEKAEMQEYAEAAQLLVKLMAAVIVLLFLIFMMVYESKELYLWGNPKNKKDEPTCADLKKKYEKLYGNHIL